ncbi:MAG: hypothetical protein INR62_04655, partial [Rhodospirillales bacterium]|nr:hypothetical protein [Acetobacter sp.]
MTEKTPDDIFALCSKLNIDGDRYRVFPKKEPRRSSPPPKSEPETVAVTAAVDEPVMEPELTEAARQASRTMLRNLSLHVNAVPVMPEHPADPLRESIVVHAAAGGVGATTVTATLARIYSR